MLKSASRILASALLIVLIFTASAFAYTTDSFDVNVVVGEDNSYKVTETIKVDFDTQKHGIFRYIPMKGSDGNMAMKIDDISVFGWEYVTYTDSGIKVIQIGDADVTVTGRQTFKYEYTMRLYDDLNDEGDILYVDLLPTDWETSIESTTIKMVLPKDVDSSKMEIYASRYGSSAVLRNISWNYDEETRTLTIEGIELPKGMGVTVYCPLEEGYWVNPINCEWIKIPFYVLCLAVPLLVLMAWIKFGQDRKVVEVVEFYPPDNLSPAEIGYVIDGDSDKKDIMSMVVYFAKKGYMSISEYAEGKFEFIKLKDIDESEHMFAKTLFDGFFPGSRKKIKMENLDERFGEAYSDAQLQISDVFTGAKEQFETSSVISAAFSMLGLAVGASVDAFMAAIYNHRIDLGLLSVPAAILIIGGCLVMLVAVNKKKSMKAAGRTAMMLLGVILAGGGCAIDAFLIFIAFKNVAMTALFVIPLVAAMFASAHMYRRTESGNKLLGRVLGFKNFIETAELDRINMLVDENPQYFFDILPYAYVLGLTDKWAKNFEKVKIVSPEWYTSYDGGYHGRNFDYWMISRMMTRCEDNISANIKYDISSGSDSAGGSFGGCGGGFSGGGFGGGGGGSW